MVIHSSSNSYKIILGEQIRFALSDFLSKDYSSVFVITDEKVAALYLADIIGNFSSKKVYESIIPHGEQSKSIESFYKLQTEAITNGLDRNSLIIALGGGVVGDLAGFIAATFMRGIDYIQIPTTILAHDSSVGGKVAINHELGKNLIGSFYPPVAVIYDIDTLKSLGEREVRSGYAEIVKEALIADESMFNTLLMTNICSVSNEQLQEHLAYGINVKANIVEADEKESGIRKYLNLGHTLAHALESELGYGALTHGEAVAIGLLFSLHVSEDVFQHPLPFQELYTWLSDNGYPTSLHAWNVDSLISKMKSDKKTVNKKIQMVLLKEIGKPTTKEIDDLSMKAYLVSFIRKLVNQ
ncbi:3-dehydroquinate synthase [Oceanobacillus bengalensis]|uniref:3-dehydroquinate synthase n=2 Tax=Oceanobacillus bengalensis TaxID=1435466 RepID=A0A494YW77_9BACI|nr:3-dehydroquinate synthase [Oceanobacillus bengalensis]RKQ13964.1 3-dehydroquinate synthase [Oceanobacillus bengalensis]